MRGSESSFVIWWDCAINVRVVRARCFEGLLFGVKGENKLSRCYLLDKKKPTEPTGSIGFNQFFRKIITTCLLGDFLDIESEKPMVLT